MLYCKSDFNQNPQNLKILVVEDSEFFNKVIYALLSREANLDIDQAVDFKQTQALLEKESYDFIILDLNLPDAYGEELVSEIKKLSEAKIIILTAEADIQVRETLFKKGILDYLVKDKHFTSSVKSITYAIESVQKNKQSTILVVDDSVFMCKQLQNILNIRNYKVQTALNAEDALHILQSQEINTIVLDMELPDKHGLEFLQDIKDIDEFCHIPAMVVSANNDPEIIRKALKIGASDFIKKRT
ncbi:MAG: response regulator [Epsilonproteobacteria bacterium]|nr:response regulator [Campylobacterota bacterium]